MAMTPAEEAAYALDWNLPRDDLKPAVQAEYDRQRAVRREQLRHQRAVDAAFPALGIQVRGDLVEAYAAPLGAAALGPLAGAQAQVTNGAKVWNPAMLTFLPAGLATRVKATAFVIFADRTYHETELDGDGVVRDAQVEAVRFNLLTGPLTPASPPQDDVASVLRKLASLREEGLLTEEEYAAKRAEVIARI